MNKVKRTLVLLFLLGMGLTVFTGCHTAHGAGQDIENAGQGIKNATE